LSVLTLVVLVVGCSSTSSVKPEQAEVVYIPVPKVRYMAPDPVGQLFNDGPRRVVIYPPDAEPLTTLFSEQQPVETQPVIIRREVILVQQPTVLQSSREPTVTQPPKNEPPLELVATLSSTAPADIQSTAESKQSIEPVAVSAPPVVSPPPTVAPDAFKPLPPAPQQGATQEGATASALNAALTQQPLAMNKPETSAQTVEPVLTTTKTLPAMNGLKPNNGTWPISGKPLNVFGAKGENGEAWRGLIISGKQNAPVGSIEAGKVVFAQPLRRYGNTIIVDHGKEYMSVYSFNDQLVKSVGDMVQKGEKIASVGKSGPIPAPALYLEVRQKGSPINPSLFLK
jgi:murein DD-endopeptidase MepM/ murein hydrolase activator NlpD